MAQLNRIEAIDFFEQARADRAAKNVKWMRRNGEDRTSPLRSQPSDRRWCRVASSISGNTAAVERAAKLADERGAKRAKLLPVSAPFHCSLMKPAQDRLEGDLRKLAVQEPIYPVVCNVDAELVTDELRARDTLVRQVTGSVKWDPCMRLLIAQGVQTFIEVGPGKVLCGLMRQIDRSKTCLNVGDDISLAKTLESLTRTQG